MCDIVDSLCALFPDEMIRQITIECAERGLLLLRYVILHCPLCTLMDELECCLLQSA